MCLEAVAILQVVAEDIVGIVTFLCKQVLLANLSTLHRAKGTCSVRFPPVTYLRVQLISKMMLVFLEEMYFICY